jgi:AraC-like DNA-binding protein
MSFHKIIPIDVLKPYIKHFVISESSQQRIYKVLPSTKLVLGFQYKGFLSSLENNIQHTLATAGITGIQNSFKTFENSVVTGTILVYFTETGFTYFSNLPAHELFNQSVSLDNIFDKSKILEAEEKLSATASHKDRIKIIEQFLLSQIKESKEDKLIVEAVKLIYQSNGLIKIKELTQKLFISQSPFEKRFRSLVGSTPKKFASIIRFNAVLNDLEKAKSLTDLCFEHNFFDQAHFIKDFKQYTGDTPENFKRLL